MDKESRALRHVFAAEHSVKQPSLIASVQPRDLKKIAIMGGGLMGAGIAGACLSAGYRISVIERNSEAATAAMNRVAGIVAGALRRGKIDQSQHDARLESLSVHASYEEASGSDLVIEAVFEDLEVKQQVFASLSDVVSRDTILATNTSYLDPREIFSSTPRLERCIGLHFFSPAHIMRLMEIIHLPETARETLASGFDFAKHLGKVGVLSGICTGFIGNRMLAAYRRAAEYMLADGALPQDIDGAMRAFGMAMGPFQAQDMSGLQIAEANRRRQDATRDVAERYVTISDQLCASGRLGQSTGLGWYRYEPGDKTPQTDQYVTEIIQAYSQENGITRRHFPDTEIQDQLLAVLANEGARIVEEGIAQDEGSVDVVKIHGYGFPRWRGGPMYMAAEMGEARIIKALDALEHASPGSWKRAKKFS